MADELNQPVSNQSNGPGDSDAQGAKEDIKKTYDVEGLLGGGAAGFVVGLIISFDAIFALQIGMFLGLIIGTRFKKNK
ncbi:MAG: hypothetical protein FWD54_02985 [Endomicrobia bacterium]|nr:hypothetical protein [Endomicrobiia bacterium]MCL2799229.1 hypothetical protein [Endomicrobiia bacterium]